MLGKLWRWLKNLWRRWFGGDSPDNLPSDSEPTKPKLSSSEYEQCFFELVDGVLDEVWSRGRVKGFFFAKNVSQEELIVWFEEFAQRVKNAPDQEELGQRLLDFGEIGERLYVLAEIGELAEELGRELLGKEVVVSPQQESEEVEQQEVLQGETEVGSTADAEKSYVPESVELFNQGLVKFEAGDFTGAIQLWSEALALEPNDHKAYCYRGAAKLGLGRFKEAIADYDQALAIEPNDHNYYGNRGSAKFCLGRFKEAITDYDQAIAIEPNNHIAYNGRGNAKFNLGRYKEAIADYDQAIAIQPNFNDAYNGRGLAKSKLGKYEEAIADYDQAIAIKPNDHLAYYNRGFTKSDLGRYEEAIIDFNQVIAFQPNFNDAYSNRGLAKSKLGKYEEAIADYDQAIAIQPNFNDAYNRRGLAKSDLGRYKEAIADYDQAIAIEPYFWQVWGNRGDSVFKSRGYEAAIANWDQGLTQLNPGNREYNLGSATLNWRKGDAHYYQAKHQTQYPLYQEAINSYDAALNFLEAKFEKQYQQTYLKILQGLVKTNLAISRAKEAEHWENKAVNLFEKMFQESSPGYRIVLLRQFSGLYQLRVDRLAKSHLKEKQIAALELAEKRKNLSLAWMQGNEETPSPNYEEIRQLLTPQTALVYWHLSPLSLTTFILTDTDFQVWTKELFSVLPSPTTETKDNLDNWLTKWKKAYQQLRKKEKKADSAELQQWQTGLAAQLNELGTYLNITDLLEYVGDIQQLILIPHRDLHLLPLNYLFRDCNFPTTILPSAKLGRQLQQLPPHNNQSPSLLSIEHPETEQPLLFAEIESAFITYLHQPAKRLAGEAATKENVIAEMKKSSDIFHFTGHGEHNITEPRNSALATANNERLTWTELFKLNLPNYYLVCLSACETGLTGNAELIDEFVGLTSVFLARNTRYVLSTLWTVEEISTALLIIEFYRYLKADIPPASALKQAQTWLRNLTHGELGKWYSDRATEIESYAPASYLILSRLANKSNKKANQITEAIFSNPYYWAGFTLTGYP